MKTTEQGRTAEAAVADYLRHSGFGIVEQNWRTRQCEIDLVAKRDEIVYFVEVKYRAGQAQGEGLDYITPKKLKQMNFAAEVWLGQNGWEGDWRLAAASVSGLNYENIEYIEI